MTTSIRQKITLFTLVPAVIFYSVVTVVDLYFSFRSASAEISRRHLHQSLQYSAVVAGNLEKIHVAGKAIRLFIENIDGSYPGMSNYLGKLLDDNDLITGVGVVDSTYTDNKRIQVEKEWYWEKTTGDYSVIEKHHPPFQISDERLESLLHESSLSNQWYVDPSSENIKIFRSSLLIPVKKTDDHLRFIRVDVDGARLIEPLSWIELRTRLIILNQQGIVIYANGISLPRLRNLEQFITAGPCDGYSKINVTSETADPLNQFIASPIHARSETEPCGVYREALYRVTKELQSINFRVSIRNDRKWVTATPVPSTGWYLSVSILEDDIMGPMVNQAMLSVSLIALAMILTLICLWVVSGRITRPLNKLKEQMNAFASPFSDVDFGLASPDEAVSLTRSFSELKLRLVDRELALQHARSNNMGHLVQQLRGGYFYFNLKKDGTIIYVSPSLSAVLGYELWEFSGKIQNFLTDSPINRNFKKTLLALVKGLWQEAFEVDMRHQNGSVRRIEMFCTVHSNFSNSHSFNQTVEGLSEGNAIEGMANDITLRIKDTQKFKSLLASSPDAAVITNEDGIISLVNRKVMELFHFSEDELSNMPLALLIAYESRSELPLLKPIDQNNVHNYCLETYLSQGQNRSGQQFPIEISSNVLDTSDGVLISIVFRDISERKKIESELVSAKEQAEKASQAKSMFLSNITHELRTPLNGVLGYAQLLLADRDIPVKCRSTLSSLEDCGRHLLILINDILDITKIESSGIHIDPHSFDLRITLNTVLANVKETARRKSLILNLDIDERINKEIIGDNVKLRQVLINLMGNAVKFTDNGSVSLFVRQKDGRLFFEVRDTGVGISESEFNKLFKPFSQLQSGKSKGGTGLGLAISSRLVHAMDGDLTVSSIVNEGSSFKFSIPDQPSPEQALKPDEQSLTLNDHIQYELNVLVVDDCPNSRDVLFNAVQGRGFKAFSAASGQEAIECCKQTRVDLILMDIRMPDLDGIETARIIQNISGVNKKVIIAVSASDSEFSQQEMDETGFSGFVRKPVEFDELFGKIAREIDLNQKTSICSSKKTPVELSCRIDCLNEMITVLTLNLEMGDIESLQKKANDWQGGSGFGDYPIRILNYCSCLDLQNVERLRLELIEKKINLNGV